MTWKRVLIDTLILSLRVKNLLGNIILGLHRMTRSQSLILWKRFDTGKTKANYFALLRILYKDQIACSRSRHLLRVIIIIQYFQIPRVGSNLLSRRRTRTDGRDIQNWLRLTFVDDDITRRSLLGGRLIIVWTAALGGTQRSAVVRLFGHILIPITRFSRGCCVKCSQSGI